MKTSIVLFITFLVLIILFFGLFKPTAKIIQSGECNWVCSEINNCSIDNGEGLKLQFFSDEPQKVIVSSIDSATIDTSGDNTAEITFRSNLAENDYTFYFSAYNEEQKMLVLKDNGNRLIHIRQGEELNETEYIIADSGDFGRIFYLEKIPPYPGNQLLITDVVSQKIFPVTLVDGKAVLSVDNQDYYILKKTATSIMMTWGDGADFGKPGTITIPKIKLNGGDYIQFVDKSALETYNLNNAPETGVVFIDSTGNSVLVPMTVPAGTSRLSIGTPVFLSGKCSENIAQSEYSKLTCQKTYTAFWHLANCNTKNCGTDELNSCKKLLFFLSKEVCASNSMVECAQNPECPEGYGQINKEECS